MTIGYAACFAAALGLAALTGAMERCSDPAICDGAPPDLADLTDQRADPGITPQEALATDLILTAWIGG